MELEGVITGNMHLRVVAVESVIRVVAVELVMRVVSRLSCCGLGVFGRSWLERKVVVEYDM